MTSIIKKELQQYFTTMSGYVFLTAFILTTALIFVTNNVLGSSSDYASTLFSTLSIFLILIPLLTMRLFAEEAKQKTDQLLYTSPITISSIVLGKFLSALILFLVGLLITLTFPIILNNYGEVITPLLLGSIFGYILLISCFISVGIFVSSITDNQITAGFITFATVFLFFILNTIIGSLPSDRLSAVIFVSFIVFICSVITLDSTKSKIFSIVTFIALMAVLLITFYINPTLFDNGIFKILSWFSLLGRFEGFVIGVINLSDVIYYISFIILFIYLTISNIEKRRWK